MQGKVVSKCQSLENKATEIELTPATRERNLQK